MYRWRCRERKRRITITRCRVRRSQRCRLRHRLRRRQRSAFCGLPLRCVWSYMAIKGFFFISFHHRCQRFRLSKVTVGGRRLELSPSFCCYGRPTGRNGGESKIPPPSVALRRLYSLLRLLECWDTTLCLVCVYGPSERFTEGLK